MFEFYTLQEEAILSYLPFFLLYIYLTELGSHFCTKCGSPLEE